MVGTVRPPPATERRPAMPTDRVNPLTELHPRPAPASGRRTYSVPEAAAILGISRAKAYECVRRGELRALSFGRRIVVPASVIEELLGGAGTA